MLIYALITTFILISDDTYSRYEISSSSLVFWWFPAMSGSGLHPDRLRARYSHEASPGVVSVFQPVVPVFSDCGVIFCQVFRTPRFLASLHLVYTLIILLAHNRSHRCYGSRVSLVTLTVDEWFWRGLIHRVWGEWTRAEDIRHSSDAVSWIGINGCDIRWLFWEETVSGWKMSFWFDLLLKRKYKMPLYVVVVVELFNIGTSFTWDKLQFTRDTNSINTGISPI